MLRGVGRTGMRLDSKGYRVNKVASALTVLGMLALAGCNVTTANSTEPANVAADNTSTGTDTGTMGEQAAALNAATDADAATDRGTSSDMMANDASSTSDGGSSGNEGDSHKR